MNGQWRAVHCGEQHLVVCQSNNDTMSGIWKICLWHVAVEYTMLKIEIRSISNDNIIITTIYVSMVQTA